MRTWTRTGRGWSASTARSSGRIIMPPGPVTNLPRTSRPSGWRRCRWSSPSARPRASQGASANHKNLRAEQRQDLERGKDRENLGRSRGGLSTKIHLAADSRCRPLSRVTTAGQRHDSLAMGAVLARVKIIRTRAGRPRTRPDGVLADKAYSTSKIRAMLRRRGITATIPQPANQIAGRKARGANGGRPPAFDPERYKDRNVVERCINKLREHRAVATRTDKRDFVYRGTIDVASIRIWLRNPVSHHSRDTP
jgi:transposase